MEDIEGDRKIGSHTLPVFIGLRVTKFFTAIVITMINNNNDQEQ